jgi:hypothetical protein
MTRSVATSTLISWPLNSQLASRERPSALKSRWSTPKQGTDRLWRSRMVWGSRKSRRRRRSATTTARRPSGVKYRL